MRTYLPWSGPWAWPLVLENKTTTDAETRALSWRSHDPFVLWWLTFKAYFMSAAVPATELKRERSSVQTLPNQALGTEGKLASHCWSWPCRQIERLLVQVATATVASMPLSLDYSQASPRGSGSLHPSPWGNCSHVLGDRPADRGAARCDQNCCF